MPLSALMDTSSYVIYVNNLVSNFNRGTLQGRIDHEALDQSVFRYRVGSYYSAKLAVDYMSSADASRVNDWWESKTQLMFDEAAEVGSVSGVSSLFIANRNAPMSIAIEGDITYWRGTIELESF